MKNTTVRDFFNSLHDIRELPVAAVNSPLAEVVRTIVKGHRRRVVYVVNPDDRLMGKITLSHLK